jgi:cell division protein FtsA
MTSSNELLVGLDIGTTKICCIVAQPNEQGGVDVVGLGEAPSTGMDKGMVTNIDRTVGSIRKAVEEAQSMAGCLIESAYVGIAGGHISGFNSQGVIAVKDRGNREITADDIRRVKEAAMALNIPMDRDVLHTIPQEYTVDSQEGIQDPTGMSGVRLEVKLHVVTGAVNAIQNIVKCAFRADLDINDMVLESVASAEAVLSPEEKELGVSILDMGGGTTDIAIFSKGSIRHTAVMGMGGNTLTKDLAKEARISLESAELLKINWGCCLDRLVTQDLEIEVPSISGGAPTLVTRQAVCNILENRVEEIFGFINHEFISSGFDEAVSQVIITGGSSLLEGVPELAAEIFNRQVRRGFPKYVGGLSELVTAPKYATAIGLVLYGLRNSEAALNAKRADSHKVGFLHRVLDRLKEELGFKAK